MPNPISKKLLLSKWSACKPKNKEKHFLVSKVHDSALLAVMDLFHLKKIMCIKRYYEESLV